jgi:hypothetical protein
MHQLAQQLFGLIEIALGDQFGGPENDLSFAGGGIRGQGAYRDNVNVQG